MLHRLLLFAAMGAVLCPAQNWDMAVLFSVRRSSYDLASPPVVTKASSTQVWLGIVSAIQLREHGPHRLYAEFAYLSPGGRSASLEPGRIETRNSALSMTGGPRYQYAISDRWSIYAAVGAGAAWYSQATVLNSSPFAVVSRNEVSPTIGYGGGLDCRLTRLISLRGDLRHFTFLGDVPGGHNGFAPSFGVGIHF